MLTGYIPKHMSEQSDLHTHTHTHTHYIKKQATMSKTQQEENIFKDFRY